MHIAIPLLALWSWIRRAFRVDCRAPCPGYFTAVVSVLALSAGVGSFADGETGKRTLLGKQFPKNPQSIGKGVSIHGAEFSGQARFVESSDLIQQN